MQTKLTKKIRKYWNNSFFRRIRPCMSKLANIDVLIESYDVLEDSTLLKHYVPIKDHLWQNIENYGNDINEYGTVISQHLLRSSTIGAGFLKILGFSERAAKNFYEANLLQDLGKIHYSYDPNIWQTPHRPTDEEREEKREHTRLGVELLDLALLKSPEELQTHPHIRVTQSLQQHHHERIDGSGYEGLKGSDMGQIIKAICIIDAYDGDMIHRPHQPAKRTPEETLDRLKNGEKYQGAFDEVMLDQFIDFTLS